MNQQHHPGCRCKACVDYHLALGLAEAYSHLSLKTKAMLAGLPAASAEYRRRKNASVARSLFPGCTP